MTGRLHGKEALISGSDSGIGQATEIEFAKEGADVVAHYIKDEEGAGHTRAAVKGAGRAIVAQADITDEEQVEALFDAAIDAFKRAAEPEEIGRLGVFLASPDSDYVTGSTYFMDGGLMQNVGQGA